MNLGVRVPVPGILRVAVFLLGVSGSFGQQTATPGQKPAARPVAESVTIEPAEVTLTPGDSQLFTARVNGAPTAFGEIEWSVDGVSGGSAAVGSVNRVGLYVTPFPAPASVTLRAASKADPTRFATATIRFAALPLEAGPALRVDAAGPSHSISPLIYGMNAWRLEDPDGESAKVAKAVRLPVNRWGGDGTTLYNYKLDMTNAGNDWYFENRPNANTKYPDVSEFNSQVQQDRETGAKTMGTAPVIGWVATSRQMAGSFSVKKYGPQQKTDPYWHDFGNGLRPDGKPITGNDPTDTAMRVDASWARDWVEYLVHRFGDAAHGGVAIYSLDNEPNWWDSTHRDVHPQPFTYDELTQNGLEVARAVKSADPTAEVTGPVIDYWLTYFYSKADLKAMWAHGLNPAAAADRAAHGSVPLMEYYLRAFKAAQDADPKHVRLLDYVDIHTYFAANDAMLKPAGNSRQQKAVLDSTRVLWDPTYTNFLFRDPDKPSKPAAPAIIPRMKHWVADDYPGTKTAITEYNWGGAEHISGAVAEADILGIFGREGLDLGTIWGPPEWNAPLMFAFKMYRNYDDAGACFGDDSLTASSADQGKLSIYAARRNKDHVLTVVAINKTFGDLTDDVVLEHFRAKGSAKLYQYSGVDLKRIREAEPRKVTWSRKNKASVVEQEVFPAMSVTLLAIREK